MPKILEKYGEFMSTSDVQEYLNICEASTYKIFYREDFPSIRIGKLLKVRTEKFMEWMEQQEQQSIATQ